MGTKTFANTRQGGTLPGMKSLLDIERKSPDLICPDCGTCSISVLMPCRDTDRKWLSVASCQNCGKQYDADALPTYLERYCAFRQDVERKPCPVCAGGPLRVHSLCDRIARQCFFLVACSACGDVHVV